MRKMELNYQFLPRFALVLGFAILPFPFPSIVIAAAARRRIMRMIRSAMEEGRERVRNVGGGRKAAGNESISAGQKQIKQLTAILSINVISAARLCGLTLRLWILARF
jgi:hypothetical protein